MIKNEDVTIADIKRNDLTIKDLNETLKILEKSLDQYNSACSDTHNLIKCIEKITDKIVELS